MPTITDHQSKATTKTLLIGDSGSGKTGSFCSLVEAGYNLRVLDLDNGMDIIANYILKPDQAGRYTYPKARERVLSDPNALRYVTLTERYKGTANGVLMPTTASVWPNMVKLLTNWTEPKLDPEGKPVKDAAGKTVLESELGPISNWSSNDVLALDSLTMVGNAAYNYDASLNGKLGGGWTQNEHRRAIGRAQDMVEKLLQLLTDANVKCNVVVSSHITYVPDQDAGSSALPGENESGGPQKGFPSVLGKSLSPRVPRYFNSVLYVRTTGSGSATKHRIYTRAQGTVNVKTSAPQRVKPEYPLENGLADFFRDVRS